MIVEFDKSFYRHLNKINDKNDLAKIESCILRLEKAPVLRDLSEAKKLTGFKSYYKIRIGDYRLGFQKLSSNKIKLIIIARRSDIYKQFP